MRGRGIAIPGTDFLADVAAECIRADFDLQRTAMFDRRVAADHPDALAVWEYLDRSIDPTIVSRAFALPDRGGARASTPAAAGRLARSPFNRRRAGRSTTAGGTPALQDRGEVGLLVAQQVGDRRCAIRIAWHERFMRRRGIAIPRTDFLADVAAECIRADFDLQRTAMFDRRVAADHPDALAVWEYLDRSIDPTIVSRAFALLDR